MATISITVDTKIAADFNKMARERGYAESVLTMVPKQWLPNTLLETCFSLGGWTVH